MLVSYKRKVWTKPRVPFLSTYGDHIWRPSGRVVPPWDHYMPIYLPWEGTYGHGGLRGPYEGTRKDLLKWCLGYPPETTHFLITRRVSGQKGTPDIPP